MCLAQQSGLSSRHRNVYTSHVEKKWRVVSLKDIAGERKEKQPERLTYCKQCPLTHPLGLPILEPLYKQALDSHRSVGKREFTAALLYVSGMALIEFILQIAAAWYRSTLVCFIVVLWPCGVASVSRFNKVLIVSKQQISSLSHLFSQFLPLAGNVYYCGKICGTSSERIWQRTKPRGLWWGEKMSWKRNEYWWTQNGQVALTNKKTTCCPAFGWQSSIRHVFRKSFLHPWLLFSFSWLCSFQGGSLWFNELLSIMPSMDMLLVLFLNSHSHTQNHLDFLLCYLPGVLCLTGRSVIHSGLISLKDVRSVSRLFLFFGMWSFPGDSG